MPHYYVEMPKSLGTTTNNHEEKKLVVDLENVIMKSKDLIGSNQSEEVGLAHLLSLFTLPTKRRQCNEPLVDYSSSHVVTLIFGYSKIKGCGQRKLQINKRV
jgi:hypothetical protein